MNEKEIIEMENQNILIGMTLVELEKTAQLTHPINNKPKLSLRQISLSHLVLDSLQKDTTTYFMH